MKQSMPKQWYGPAARTQRRWRANRDAYESHAFHEAEQLGHAHVGAEHLLLALVAPGDTSLAAQALRASGVEYDALHAAMNGNGAAPARPLRKGGSRTHPPAFYALAGRSDGLAAGLGAGQIEPEHLLLAILWEPSSRARSLLGQLGTSPHAVQRRLAKLGAKVPSGRPPLADDTRWGEFVTVRVPSSDAWELASRIQHLLPEGAPIGFNFNGTSAWFRTGEGIELAPIVRKARRQQLARRRRLSAEQA